MIFLLGRGGLLFRLKYRSCSAMPMEVLKLLQNLEFALWLCTLKKKTKMRMEETRQNVDNFGSWMIKCGSYDHFLLCGVFCSKVKNTSWGKDKFSSVQFSCSVVSDSL